MSTFDFIGKLHMAKETEKFKPYESTTSPKGWTTNKLLFNVIAGDNRHMLESKGGFMADGKGKVFTFSKGKVVDGTKEKGEKLEIAWADRLKQENIDKVAEFKKYVVDLEEYGKRYKLEKALEKKDTLTEEDLAELGVEDIEKALDESKKKRKEYIAASDFTNYLYKAISSGKLNDKLFRISGDIVNEYSDKTGRFYRKLVPTRIYLGTKDDKPTSIGQMTVFFNKNCIDDSLVKKTGKYIINAFIREYDSNRKDYIPCPISFVLDTTKDAKNEKNKKLNDFMLRQFTVKDKSWKELGIKFKMLDGAQKVEITEDMLTQEQKELLEIEAITMDDIRKELGKDIYGDKVQEMVIINVGKGYSKGRSDTKYVDSDFVMKEIEIKEKPKEETPAVETEEEEIFDIDDIDI